MQDILISVIVPVYGAEKSLDKCVSSIRNQTYEELEIILVDDGSKDRGGEMCDEYAQLDSRIKVIHKANGGLMSAWSEGVKAAKGEYFCFVDSDDWIEKDMIGEMSAFITGKREIICCNYVMEHADGKCDKMRHGAKPGEYQGEELSLKIKKEILGHENRTVSMSRCMKLTKAELIRENLHYLDLRIKMGEDMSIMLPVILDADRVVIMKDSYFYHYYYNDESIVHSYDEGLNTNMERLFAVMDAVLSEKCNGEKTYEPMKEKEKLFLFMLQLKNELRKGKGAEKRVLALIKENNIKEKCSLSPLIVKDKGNQLLYLVMRHPSYLTALLLKTAFELKNRG